MVAFVSLHRPAEGPEDGLHSATVLRTNLLASGMVDPRAPSQNLLHCAPTNQWIFLATLPNAISHHLNMESLEDHDPKGSPFRRASSPQNTLALVPVTTSWSFIGQPSSTPQGQ